MKLVHHFTTYREKTATQVDYSNRKICTRCNLAKSIVGSATVARPGSRRRDFVCAGCKP
jgi:hypothetical protein